MVLFGVICLDDGPTGLLQRGWAGTSVLGLMRSNLDKASSSICFRCCSRGKSPYVKNLENSLRGIVCFQPTSLSKHVSNFPQIFPQINYHPPQTVFLFFALAIRCHHIHSGQVTHATCFTYFHIFFLVINCFIWFFVFPPGERSDINYAVT